MEDAQAQAQAQAQEPNTQDIEAYQGCRNAKPNTVQCMYCDKYFSPSMTLSGLTYCGNCWSIYNYYQFKFSQGTYEGIHEVTEVIQYLKKTMVLHGSQCKHNECIYKTIHECVKNDTLHDIYSYGLGFKKINICQKVSSTQTQDVDAHVCNNVSTHGQGGRTVGADDVPIVKKKKFDIHKHIDYTKSCINI